jgi:hypothetical protein
MSYFILPPFSNNTPNKIGEGIDVSGRNTLVKTENECCDRVAIADEPIDAKIDGKKMFCVRVDNAGAYPQVMIGFTPLETFDSSKWAFFGIKGFNGAGIRLGTGSLYYSVSKFHNIIDFNITRRAKEIIVILTISDNGKKKEIQFLVDGHESKSTDVSEHLKGDLLFPAIVLGRRGQQVTTIPIDQIKSRTPEIERLFREEHISFGVKVETKKENTKEKKAKHVATKKTKKETIPKTTKATKKKEETKNNNKEKNTKVKK